MQALIARYIDRYVDRLTNGATVRLVDHRANLQLEDIRAYLVVTIQSSSCIDFISSCTSSSVAVCQSSTPKNLRITAASCL